MASSDDTQMILRALEQSKPKNGIALLVAMASIAVAIIAPAYQMIGHVGEALDHHVDQSSHLGSIEKLATLEQKLSELDDLLEWKSKWEPRVRSLDSKQNERIDFLWSQLFSENAMKPLNDRDEE